MLPASMDYLKQSENTTESSEAEQTQSEKNNTSTTFFETQL